MAHLRGGIRTDSMSGHERYRPNRQDMDRKEEQAGETQENVGYNERVLTGIVGGGLLLRSVMRPASLTGGIAALLGIALVHRAVSGYCAAYGAMGINTQENNDTSSLGRRKVRSDRAVKVEQSITIQRPAQDLYRFWRQLDNLPKVMSHVRSVQPINDHLSHWIVDTMPGAPTVEWDAEIINEVEHERIGWRTLHGAAVEHTGSVAFEPLEDGRSSRVTVTLQYDPPAGPIGAAVANLLGQDPGRKIKEDLARFKETMEAEVGSSR
ncbi:MAG: Cyclase/dehydrase [Nitrospira sp.]|nr:Cyclase/dehydrase [Nitrospira sp.]